MFYVGIDFGGTNIRAVASDRNKPEISKIIKTPLLRKETVKEEIGENIIPLINQLIHEKKQENKRLDGIGIATAALFERRTGRICNWPNNPKYKGFPLMEYLEEYYKVPVLLEDDANAAALGEQLTGEAVGATDFVYVTVSTGIGSGIILNDKLITGYHGWAGELGHIKVTEEDILCSCGSKGCLQAVASGPAILKKIKETQFYKQNPYKSNLTLKNCVEYARQGNQELKKSFQEAGYYIGKALANTVMLLDVPLIILGGGVTEASDLIIEPIQESISNSLGGKRKVRIIRSKLNDINGVLGALWLVKKNRIER